MALTAGYSSKPLWSKLGLIPGVAVCVVNTTADAVPRYWLDPPFPVALTDPAPGLGYLHLFVGSRRELVDQVGRLLPLLKPDGTWWVSWPKKASGHGSDLTDGVLRDVFLPLGLVDVKVCSVTDELWSGLKLVWRLENRGAT